MKCASQKHYGSFVAREVRNAYFESGANAQFTFYFDFTFVRFGDVFADAESQPATPFIL